MSLGLHEGCRQRLIELLSICLPEFRVNNGSFLNRQSLKVMGSIDDSIPKQRDLTERLESYLSETPFFDFVYGYLSQEIYETQQFNSESTGIPLTSIPEYTDPTALAHRLVQSFEDLPRTYRITFKLNSTVSAHIPDKIYELSEKMYLIRPDDEFTQKFPLTSDIPGRNDRVHGGGLHWIIGSKEWDQTCHYLQLENEGFMGGWASTTPEEFSVSSLKSILGLCFAIRAFDEITSYSFSTVKHRVYVHEKDAETWKLYTSFELDEALSNLISNLKIDDLEGTLQTDEQKSGFISNRFRLLKVATSQPSINERVLLAGRWLLDSYLGKNELLSFVQSAVALEILLGDKAVSDVIGLGELLRNRCAYMIGKSHHQREEILNDFGKIYDVRSKIVHRGKDRLSNNERQLFHKLRWMVNRVIQEEVELMSKNT